MAGREAAVNEKQQTRATRGVSRLIGTGIHRRGFHSASSGARGDWRRRATEAETPAPGGA